MVSYLGFRSATGRVSHKRLRNTIESNLTHSTIQTLSKRSQTTAITLTPPPRTVPWGGARAMCGRYYCMRDNLRRGISDNEAHGRALPTLADPRPKPRQEEKSEDLGSSRGLPTHSIFLDQRVACGGKHQTIWPSLVLLYVLPKANATKPVGGAQLSHRPQEQGHGARSISGNRLSRSRKNSIFLSSSS